MSLTRKRTEDGKIEVTITKPIEKKKKPTKPVEIKPEEVKVEEPATIKPESTIE